MIKTALIFVNISAVFNVNYYEVFSFCTSKRKPLRFSCLLFLLIIDFLNVAYNDDISYEAKLYYDDKEINNFQNKSNRYIITSCK